MADAFTDQLSAYLDGELDELRRRRLEAHLAECPDCTAMLADLRAIVAAAPHYQGRDPARDLWPAIDARLDEPEVVHLPSAERRAPSAEPPSRRVPSAERRVPRFSWSQLLAASLLMAAFGAGATWIALRPSERPGPPPLTRAGRGDSAAPKTVAFAEARYESAVADLTRIVEQGRGRLDTATVRVIDESLRKIDLAIAEARAALQRDSSNQYLNRQIAANMRRKLALLRLAADAIART